MSNDFVIRINPFQDDRPKIPLSDIRKREKETGLDFTFLFNEGYALLIDDTPKERQRIEKYPRVKVQP